MEFNENVRISVKYLFRVFFDDTPNKNPFDDEKELCVSNEIISVLTDIIIYCYNPILYYKYEDYTHIVANELLKNKQLISKLPESIKELINVRSIRKQIITTDIPFLCQQIITAARQNYEYWNLRRKNKLEWGKCDINDIVERDIHYSYRENDNINSLKMNTFRPYKKEGWIPVILHSQMIYILEGEYISSSEPSAWTEAKIMIDYNTDHKRPITREIFNMPRVVRENDYTSWKEVKLLLQRAWIYYEPSKFHLFPPSSTVDKFVIVTLTTSFPSIQGCTFFIERNVEESPFRVFTEGDVTRSEYANMGRDGFTTNAYLISDGEETTNTEEVVEQRNPLSYTEDERLERIIVSDLNTNVPTFQKIPICENTLNRFNIAPAETPGARRIRDNSQGKNIKLRFVNQEESNTWSVFLLQSIINQLGISELYENFTLFESIMQELTTSGRPTGDLPFLCEYIILPESAGTLSKGYFDFAKLLNIYSYHADGSLEDDYDRINSFFEGLSEVIVERVPRQYKSTMPKDYVKLLVTDALTKETNCPISMDVLSPSNASIISCFHMFDIESIKTWLETKKTCPVCRSDIKWITEPIEN